MSTLLYIKASPRIRRSWSLKVTENFIEDYRQAHPDDKIDVLDIFEADFPSFDGLTVQAKYSILHGQEATSEMQAAWQSVEEIIARFSVADKYVLAVPMWNFGIPYRLKQYIDILVQPTYTFSYSPEEGYQGLLHNRKVFIAYARGGDYPLGTEAEGLDFQKKYIETILGFIGITDIQSVIVQPTLAEGPETAQQKLDEALKAARRIVADF